MPSRKRSRTPLKASQRLERQYFAPLPYDITPPRGHVDESQVLDSDGGLSLILKRPSFKSTKNPLYVIEAIVLAHDLGLYPPQWALDFLVGGMRRWHQGQGKKNLENCLGLRGGKGVDTAFKKARIEERNDMLCTHVANLVALGATQDEALSLAAAQLARSKDWNKSGWSMRSIDVDRLRRIYAKSWARSQDQAELRKWLLGREREYLARFPREHLPKKLIKLL